MYGFLKFIAWIIVKLFFSTKVIGRENFIDKGCIIVCNHFSAWDIPVAYTSTPHRLIALGKKEVVNHKILGQLFKKLGAIPVDRENVQPSTIREVIIKLKEGGKLLLYPEGTRKKKEDGKMNKLKNGAALFALSTGVPVIPMMMDRKPKAFRKNILMVGQPIYFEGLKPDKEGIDKASQIIKNNMDGIKARIEDYKQSKKRAKA